LDWYFLGEVELFINLLDLLQVKVDVLAFLSNFFLCLELHNFLLKFVLGAFGLVLLLRVRGLLLLRLGLFLDFLEDFFKVVLLEKDFFFFKRFDEGLDFGFALTFIE
jgi:hypothetical protein